MSKRFLFTLTGCLLAPLLLAGCNGGEDFSDADIGGPVVEPSPGSGSPLGEDVEAVEIEFVDDRVLGLGYECRGAQGGTGYTGYVVRGSQFEEDDDDDNPVPEVVECGTEATAVDFFLGDAAGTDRFELGTVYLPQQGKQQRYQVAPTDIVSSPARVEAAESESATDEQRRAFYIAALLQGLDNDAESDSGVIDIPYAAHEAIMSCCGPDVDVPPTPTNSAEGFADYNKYSEFDGAWSDWFGWVNNDPDATVALPSDPGTVSDRLDNGLRRLRAGTYTLEATLYGRKVVEVDDEEDIDDFLAPLLIQMPVLVYPGPYGEDCSGSNDCRGIVQGIGYVANITGSFGDFDETNSTLGAIAGNAELNNKLELVGDGDNGGWELAPLFNEHVELEFSGRFLGSNLYYDLDGPLTQGSDYETDFPQDGVYDPVESDRGFYRGEAFSENLRDDGELLTGYKTGFVGADYDTDKLPGGGGRQSRAPQFYELTPYKACSGHEDFDPGNCSEIESDDEPGINYRGSVSDDDGENSVDVTEEQPKPATYPSADNAASQESFNVEIRDDGYVVTDLDRDCSPTGGRDTPESGFSDEDSSEYLVGFVTRTNEGDEDLVSSMNLIIHMTGPAERSDLLPHYGLRTSGRINLDESGQPFYRTGDANYAGGIRALWVDQAGPSGFAYEKFRRDNQPLTSPKERESITRVRGALEGRAISSGDSACSGT